MKNNKILLLKSIKSKLRFIKLKLIKIIDLLIYGKYFKVYKNSQHIFKIKDMGSLTRFRAYTFETKEPETLKWIEEFSEGEKLLDIGANIGLYSLYAAYLGRNVVSIEPDVLNLALLNLNIKKNSFSKKITSYGIAIHNEQKFSTLNSSSFEWGSALNSFDNKSDFQGKKFDSVYSQSVFGMPLDKFLQEIDFCPNHIKIDVDGNEYLILKSGIKTLMSKELKSLLVELDEEHPNYLKSLDIINSAGFKLASKTHALVIDNSQFSSSYNHIFFKR